MSTSVSNNSKWDNQHLLTIFMTIFIPTHHFHMSSPWKSPWPFLEKPPTTHECFINRIYQQDIPANPRRPTCCQPKKTNITHNYVIWTNRLNCPNCPNRLNKPSEPSEPIWTNPSKPHQRLIHIEIPNNPI